MFAWSIRLPSQDSPGHLVTGSSLRVALGRALKPAVQTCGLGQCGCLTAYVRMPAPLELAALTHDGRPAPLAL